MPSLLCHLGLYLMAKAYPFGCNGFPLHLETLNAGLASTTGFTEMLVFTMLTECFILFCENKQTRFIGSLLKPRGFLVGGQLFVGLF